MQIAIELPNDFVSFQTEPVIRKEITTSYALWLFQQERVTLVKAAELAGMSMYDFMQICKDNKIPVLGVSRSELIEELSGLSAR